MSSERPDTKGGICYGGSGNGTDGIGSGLAEGGGNPVVRGLSYITNLIDFYGANGGMPGWDNSNRNGAGETNNDRIPASNGNIVVYEFVSTSITMNAKVYISNHLNVNSNVSVGGILNTNAITVESINTASYVTGSGFFSVYYDSVNKRFMLDPTPK